MRRAVLLPLAAFLFAGCETVKEHNDVYFSGVLHVAGPEEPRATFLRLVRTKLEQYNEVLVDKEVLPANRGQRIKADCPTETLVAIAVRGARTIT